MDLPGLPMSKFTVMPICVCQTRMMEHLRETHIVSGVLPCFAATFPLKPSKFSVWRAAARQHAILLLSDLQQRHLKLDCVIYGAVRLDAARNRDIMGPYSKH